MAEVGKESGVNFLIAVGIAVIASWLKYYSTEQGKFAGLNKKGKQEVRVRLKKEEIKKGQTEHRAATTTYPCCLPALGEFSRS